jgi:site-specific recombinase XerD
MNKEMKSYLKIVKALKSESTVETRKSGLSKFYEFMQKNGYSTDEIDERNIKMYIGFLKDEVSDLTASQYITAVSMFYDEMYERNPVSNIRQDDYLDLDNVKHSKPTLSPDQLRDLVESAEGMRAKAMISLMASSGMRVQEAVNSHISDLNLDDRYVIIDTVKTDYGERKAYFDPTTRRYISRLLSDAYRLEYNEPDSDYIFISGSDNQYDTDANISVATARRDFIIALENSDIEETKEEIADGRERSDITTHILRRSFCQNWIDQNGDLLSLKNQVGWVSIETAKSYIKEESTKEKRDQYGLTL